MNIELLKGIDDVSWGSSDSVIEFYESNTVFFENYQAVEDDDTLFDVVDIRLIYIRSLVYKDRYTKAESFIEITGHLLEKLKGTEEYFKLFERFLFNKGLVYGRIKEYEKSQECFKELIKIDPENDLYQAWVDSNKEHLVYNYSRFVGYLGLGLVLLDLFADTLFGYAVNGKLVVFGFVLVFGGFWGPKLYSIAVKGSRKI